MFYTLLRYMMTNRVYKLNTVKDLGKRKNETKLSIESQWNSNLTNGQANIFDGQLVDFDCSNIIPKKKDVL